MTLGLPDSITATQELVVPKSIPMTLNNKQDGISNCKGLVRTYWAIDLEGLV